MTTIDEFWRWFATNAEELRDEEDGDAVCDAITQELAKVHAGLVGEIERGGAEARLVLSANGDRALFPYVEQVFAQRPVVAGWDIVAFRPPAANGDLGVITMDGRELDMRAIRFVATPEHGKLELDVYVPGYADDDETISNMGFIALDHAIGEYAMETRIGGIAWYPLDEAPSDARPLAELVARMPKD